MFRPRVLIVSEHASARFGGEAILPLHYFRGLRRRGIEAFLLVHERTREELTETLGGDIDRVTFISDARVQKALHRWSGALPERLARVTLGWGIRLSTQLAARGIAKDLIRALGIHVVHQPIPVSPREPSLLYGLGAPVVMGPMNGAMRFPPAFDHMNGPATKLVTELGQRSSTVLSHLMPGKRRAAAVLYANERTRLALSSTSVALIEMPENGVELDVFSPTGRMAPEQPRFAFMGRLVDWKQVDVAIDALARARTWVRLEIVGDGPLRGALEAYACERECAIACPSPVG
ncbi:MAG: hypothetical protein M5U28_24030 [Sandaracinaceae bacterium]|nr:hypothetical protein [Sandaracinaceae bacterium]